MVIRLPTSHRSVRRSTDMSSLVRRGSEFATRSAYPLHLIWLTGQVLGHTFSSTLGVYVQSAEADAVYLCRKMLAMCQCVMVYQPPPLMLRATVMRALGMFRHKRKTLWVNTPWAQAFLMYSYCQSSMTRHTLHLETSVIFWLLTRD